MIIRGCYRLFMWGWLLKLCYYTGIIKISLPHPAYIMLWQAHIYCNLQTAGYFIGVNTLSIFIGSVLLVLSVIVFTLLVLSVALCRAKAKLQERKLKTPAHLDQDQLYEEVNTHYVHPEDVDTQPNISYVTHRELWQFSYRNMHQVCVCWLIVSLMQ